MAKAKSSNSQSKELKEQSERERTQEAQSAARATVSTNKGTKMSEELSIIEYTEELEAAEAPPVLPPGDYPAEIRGAEIKTSAAGNKYVNVTFMISPDAYPADFEGGDQDGTVLSYGRLNPADTVKARWGMKKFGNAIGVSLGKKLDLNDWIGKSAIVTVANEPYDGVQQAKISKVNPA